MAKEDQSPLHVYRRIIRPYMQSYSTAFLAETTVVSGPFV